MELHEKWLLKAEEELESARKLMEGDSPILDTAHYHAQQCAEKALKAYLSYRQRSIKKRASNPDIIFEQDIVFGPDKEEVKETIEKAREILNFVRSKTL